MGLYDMQLLEGRIAFVDGVKLQDNPYRLDGNPIEASKFFSWTYGWFQQQDKQRRKKNG